MILNGLLSLSIANIILHTLCETAPIATSFGFESHFSCEEEHFRIWIPSTTRDSTAWKKISQVCFVVFFNSTYIDGEKGLLTIRNLKMVPR